MQGPSHRFEESFRRHLVAEQRRAVLQTIASDLTPETTLGEVVDAAERLGWGDHMEELCLSALAGVLVEFDEDEPADAQAGADEAEVEAEAAAEVEAIDEDGEDDEDDDEALADDDEDEDEDEEEAEPAPRARTRKSASKRPTKAKKVTTKKTKKVASAKKVTKKVTTKKTKKASAKPVVLVDDDEAMSIDQAAKKLVPLVRKMRQATMQDLEEATGLGRRKLRFHVGQLVKHGKLKRHGMGRGTHYTVK